MEGDFRNGVRLFPYRKRYGLHAISQKGENIMINEVSIPQAVWIACNGAVVNLESRIYLFQYRKRYGLHAIRTSELLDEKVTRFNTASGMDCMQCKWEGCWSEGIRVSIPQAVWIACNSRSSGNRKGGNGFQYRKRYGLHAIRYVNLCQHDINVSIPQAVWIACNTVSRKPWKQ